MSKKRKNRDLFSVADIRQQVDEELSFQRHLEQFRTFPADNVADQNVEGLDAWIVAKFGLSTAMELLLFARSTISLPAVTRKRLFGNFFPSIDVKYVPLLETVSKRNLPAECERFNYHGSPCMLVPPTSTFDLSHGSSFERTPRVQRHCAWFWWGKTSNKDINQMSGV